MKSRLLTDLRIQSQKIHRQDAKDAKKSPPMA
jgi:hypothetical protein